VFGHAHLKFNLPHTHKLLAFKIWKAIFRSFDVEYQNNLQRLTRATKLFEQEATLAYRKHAESHFIQQKDANQKVLLALDGIAATDELDVKGQAFTRQGASCLQVIKSHTNAMNW
jgi:hypothetical protein